MAPNLYISPPRFYNCIYILILLTTISTTYASSGVFRVQRKFSGNNHRISDLKKHDVSRHSRLLSSISIPLQGNSQPTGAGLYYTEIEIGTPAKKFSVQVDTGSDILWVNCVPCDGCPESSRFVAHMTKYDPDASKTASKISCDSSFCEGVYSEKKPECPDEDRCTFQVVYADQSSTAGYFVTDVLNYSQVSGDQKTHLLGANVTFGCAAKQTGMSESGLEGLMGFGQANSSVISQLASSKKAPKIFSHCLDGSKGGGIFAIGDVVLPNVHSVPLIPNMSHYNVDLKSISVGGRTLKLPDDVFETNGTTKGTIIDSGSTLVYLPEVIYISLYREIFSKHLELTVVDMDDGFSCFEFKGSVDDEFPVVTLHFDTSVNMEVKPHDYLFQQGETWCIGWQNNGDDFGIILGDMVLTDKLVVYNLEKQTIGLTNFNCSSTIELKDDSSGSVYKYSSSVSAVEMGRVAFLLPFTFLLYFYNLLGN